MSPSPSNNVRIVENPTSFNDVPGLKPEGVVSNGTGNKPKPILRRATSRTYGSQKDLPRLPIPTLEETLSNFQKVLTVLQNAKERVDTKKLCDEFINSGDGPKLQAMLEKYDSDGKEANTFGSYIEEFWNEAYLAPDSSVVLNLNPFFVLEDGPDPKTAKDPIRRAASLTFATVKLASLLKHETLKPDVIKGRPLCMAQFKSLFGSCRLPTKSNKDSVAVYPESTHVCVMCQNQIYYFQTLWPDGTVAINENDIMDILEAIQANAMETGKEESAANAIGVLTSLSRNDWADARANMIASSESNEEALQIIDSALFVLVLDDYIPETPHETAANMLHGTYRLRCGKNGHSLNDYQAGTCLNRWYDKIQIIVCADGTSGINFEHSAIDGHTALRFVSDVFAETVVSFAQSITKSIYGAGRLPNVIDAEVNRATKAVDSETGLPLLDILPKKLVFDLPASVIDKIHFAETALGDQVIASDTFVLEFKSFGKLQIVANKMSPDSFVQMSIMLAYHRLYGKVVCQYEPVLTKTFFHGRTEAMRSAIPEAAELCHIWDSNYESKESKLQALREAVAAHSRVVKQCAGGKGVDRHLYALKCIAEKNGMEVPAFFKSDAYAKLNHTVLSTSNCGNPSLRMFGFGPVVQDGFGVGYIIRDFGIQYSVSSKHRQTERYVRTLQKTLLEIQDLMKPISTVRVENRTSGVDKSIHASRSINEFIPPAVETESYSMYGEDIEVPPPLPPRPQIPRSEPTIEQSDSQEYLVPVVTKHPETLKRLSQVGLTIRVESLVLDDEEEEGEEKDKK